MMDHTFITNFSKYELAQYQFAIDNSNADENLGLWVEERAFDVDGNLLPDHLSLHCSRKADLSLFWQLWRNYGGGNKILDS